MNLRQALLHNTGWRILVMLFTFINNIIIVRMLGAAAGADFFYAIAIFTFISTLLRFGVENGIIYCVSKYPGRLGPLLSFTGLLTILQTGITLIAVKNFIGEAVPYSFFWAVVFIVTNTTIYYITAFFQVRRMYVSINVVGAVIAGLQTAALAYFYFSGETFAKNIADCILIIMSAGGLLQLIVLCIYFFRINSHEFEDMALQKIHVKDVFHYAGINFLCSVVFYLVTRADFYFAEKYIPGIVFGNYVQAAKIGQMMLVLPVLLGGVIFPFSVNAENSFDEKISFFSRMITAAFIAALSGLLLFGKYIFVWLLGSEFTLVMPMILISFTGVWCLAVNLILTSYFGGKNLQRIILFANTLVLILIIAGDILFIPAHGYVAAATVFSVANFAGMAVLLLKFLNRTKYNLSDMFVLKSYDLKIFRFRR